MESISRDVKSLESDERRLYESVVGHALRESQRVIIRVVDLEAEPDQATSRAPMSRAVEIAREGREAARALGVTEEEANAAIEQAIRDVRRTGRSKP